MPAFGIFRQDMSLGQRVHIGETAFPPGVVAFDRGVTAMAIDATQYDGGRRMHGLLIGVRVTGLTAATLGSRVIPSLILRSRWRERIIDLLRFFLTRGENRRCRANGERQYAQASKKRFSMSR